MEVTANAQGAYGYQMHSMQASPDSRLKKTLVDMGQGERSDKTASKESFVPRLL